CGRILLRRGEIYCGTRHDTGRKQWMRNALELQIIELSFLLAPTCYRLAFQRYHLIASITAPVTTNEPPRHCSHLMKSFRRAVLALILRRLPSSGNGSHAR